MGRTRALGLGIAVAATAAQLVGGTALAANPTFAPYVSSSVANGSGPGPAPVSTVAADFTSDGRPDIATTNDFGQRDALVLRNAGAGRFQAIGGVSGTSGVQSLAAGDVDGDGRQDLVGMTSNEIVVARGNGQGGFTVSSRHPATIGGQVQAIVADLTGDGRLDIAAQRSNGIQTLINRGGSFESGPATTIPGASAISAISEARVDGDAHRDLFAIDGSSGTTFALRGNGSGGFTVSGQLPASGFVPEDVKSVDLNGDGFDDIGAIGSFSFTLATALGNGQGGFASQTPNNQYGGPGPTSLAAGEFNRDGKQDIVVSNVANPSAASVRVYTGNGTASPTFTGSFAVAPFPQNPAIADYDGDSKPDIAVASPGKLSVLLNRTP